MKLKSINAPIGLLIGNDVQQATLPLRLLTSLGSPREVRRRNGKGPYAVKTILGWTINGPLVKNGTFRHCANFIRSYPDLDDQFKKFCDMEFNEVAADSKLEMPVEDLHALVLWKDR